MFWFNFILELDQSVLRQERLQKIIYLNKGVDDLKEFTRFCSGHGMIFSIVPVKQSKMQNQTTDKQEKNEYQYSDYIT